MAKSKSLMRWMVGIVAVFMAGSATVADNVSSVAIENATYEKYFNRAKALIPGISVASEQLTDETAWEVSGGRIVAGGETMRIKTESESVEIAWKGNFPRSEQQRVNLELDIDTVVPVSVMFNAVIGDSTRSMGKPIDIDPGTGKQLDVVISPNPQRRYGDPYATRFNGFKIKITGADLAGREIILKNVNLYAKYFEGFFRRTVEIPAGEIWEAVAEVSDSVTLYVNGQRVDDENIILPRPTTRGRNFYTSRRTSLKDYLRPGKNAIGMHIARTGLAPAAYLRGSVVMNSGERIMLDGDNGWMWNRSAPENWNRPDCDDTGWLEIVDHEDAVSAVGEGYTYRGKEGIALPMTGYGFIYRPRGDMPCYDGLIKLRNPADKKFYFNENTPFQLEALLPQGFKDKNPELIWEISRYNNGRADTSGIDVFTEITRGNLKEFLPGQDSLAGEIALDKTGALERGIYVFTSRLLLDGEVVEEREPEIMVVTGKVKMPISAGDTLEQGMELTLERIIDFTNPDDPHPWFELDNLGPRTRWKWGEEFYHVLDEALIVERNGLKYRTTRPINRAQFSYFVDEFKHPNDWYLMVLEYPDDAERWIGVSCNANSRTRIPGPNDKPEEIPGADSKCGPAIWTGGKYPNTGKMLEMKWIYRPDPGGHAFNVMSLMNDQEAAAARLRIYHIKGSLPEVNAGEMPWNEQRRFGMLTERTFAFRDGIYNLFSSFERGAASGRGDMRGAGVNSMNAVIDGCAHLFLLEDAASHYAEYMRFAGQNLHAMGCFQYSDGNTAPQYITGDPRLHDSPENMLARVLAANDLMFYASVEFTSTTRFAVNWDNPELYLTDRHGKSAMAMWNGLPMNLNYLHPKVETEMLELARQLAQKFHRQDNFLGINWTTFFAGFWIPGYRRHTYPYDPEQDPMEFGYDDHTIGLFEQETGIKVPGDSSQKSGVRSQNEKTGEGDPERFERRYQFLTSPEMKPVWMAWRSKKMADFFEKINDAIREIRPNLETVAGCNLWGNHIAEWKSQEIPFHDFLNAWGWNPEAFSGRDGVWLMPWFHAAANHAPAAQSTAYAMYWQGNHDPDFYRAFSSQSRRAMMLHVGWIEVERIAANYPYREGWPRPFQQTMMAQQREEMAMEPYTQAMIGFDPQMLMMGFTDVSPYIGVEGMQRKFTRVLRRLPWGEFKPVPGTGFDSNFAIRALHRDDDYWFYVANPGYWPISGTITLKNADKAINIVTEDAVPIQNGAIKIELEPFGISAFRASPAPDQEPGTKDQGQLPAITTWSTDSIPDSELAHMQDRFNYARTALEQPGNLRGFLGEKDYRILAEGVATAERALAEKRYAAAWAALTDADFWMTAFHRAGDMPADVLQPGEMNLVWTGGNPVLDGVLNDLIWHHRGVVFTGPFLDKDGEYSDARTLLRVAWPGANRLAIAFECYDPNPENIRGTATDYEDGFWTSEDDMVVFTVMPGNSAYQFAVNAAGVQAARRITAESDKEFRPEWQAAVKKHDWGWAAEILIDHTTAIGQRQSPNHTDWKVNFHRLFRLNELPPSSWTYTTDWEKPDNMGVLRSRRH